MIADWSVPKWLSWVGLIVAGGLALFGFRFTANDEQFSAACEFGSNQTEADMEGREVNYGQAKAADPAAQCSP